MNDNSHKLQNKKYLFTIYLRQDKRGSCIFVEKQFFGLHSINSLIKQINASQNESIIYFEQCESIRNRDYLFLHKMIQEKPEHEIWLKCMQMAKCNKQSAQLFIKQTQQFLNTPLTDEGQTILMVSSSISSQHIVKEALIKGANPNSKDKVGRTALHYAASIGSIQIFEMLTQRGANPLEQSIGGETPLAKACMFCQGQIIEWYLNNALEAFEIADNCGKKPLQILRLSGQTLYDQVKQIYQDLINQTMQEEK